MYHAAVKRLTKRTYAALSRGQYDRVVRSFAPNATLTFAGDHALGGTFKGADAIGGWFERLFRVFPDLGLHPDRIVVEGGPWNTRVATCFRVTATLPNGASYRNEGMQFLNIRWGRVIEDRLVEDTQALTAALQVVSEAGVREASGASQPSS
jgi:ketosteroid isomerase-like protein